MTRVLRSTGWLFIAAGLLVLLYVVYSLLFTGVTTARAQGDMARQWGAEPGEWDLQVDDVVGSVASRTSADAGASAARTSTPRVAADGAVAVLQFRRPRSAEPIVSDDPLFVVEDVNLEALTQGPGHYPSTAGPGEDGNFAVAGHRTTYGAPFFNLDDLRPGDEVVVTAPDGERHVYRVRRSEIVAPSAGWVLGPDPLRTGKPTLTLTTCHPRFSDRQRLIVFAELL